MAKTTISKRSVDTVLPRSKPYFLWDEKLPGFGLKVTPVGGKIYVFQYRIARPGKAEQTAPKRYTIGKHGALTPELARRRAQELAALVEGNVDPRELEARRWQEKEAERLAAAEQQRLHNELAFTRLAAKWLDHYEGEKGRRPSSVRQAKLVVRNYLQPKLGDKPVPNITRFDLQEILDGIPISQKATRRAVFALSSVFFGWAAKRGLIERNLLSDLEKPDAPTPRDRVLHDNELRLVWSATEKMSDPFGAFYRLLMLTGQRREEVASMDWSELDPESRTWTTPAHRTKNGLVQILPLSEAVIAELEGLSMAIRARNEQAKPKLQAWPEAGFVFTTTGRNPISGFSKAKRALDAAVTALNDNKPLPDWRIHDLRRTLATNLQKLGTRFEVTEAILNHISGARGGVAGIYQRHDWAREKRLALEGWEARLRNICQGSQASNVVALNAVDRSY